MSDYRTHRCSIVAAASRGLGAACGAHTFVHQWWGGPWDKFLTPKGKQLSLKLYLYLTLKLKTKNFWSKYSKRSDVTLSFHLGILCPAIALCLAVLCQPATRTVTGLTNWRLFSLLSLSKPFWRNPHRVSTQCWVGVVGGGEPGSCWERGNGVVRTICSLRGQLHEGRA